MTWLRDGWIGHLLVTRHPLYSKNTKGTDTIIEVLLSRDFKISDQSLTKKPNSVLPPQKAASFHIKMLPIDIISWILSLAAF